MLQTNGRSDLFRQRSSRSFQVLGIASHLGDRSVSSIQTIRLTLQRSAGTQITIDLETDTKPSSFSIPHNKVHFSQADGRPEGNSISDIHKNFGFYDPLSPLSAFGTDLWNKIHATSLTMSAFP